MDAEARQRSRRRLTWSLLAAGAVLSIPALWLVLRPRPVPFAARFRTEPASRGDILREVRATGHVEAVTTVEVGAEISGRITEVDVDYNAAVKQGEVLARFDTEALLAELKQSLANLTAARAALEQAKTDRERTSRDWSRARQLRRALAITEADYDNAASAARLAEQKVAAADANLAAQQAAYNVARTNLDHSVIHAPIDGIVITRNVDPGQTVASVFQTPVLFTVAADLRKMRVIAAVDEADIGEVAVGQKASFTVNAYPDRVFEGVVTEVRNSPVVVQDVVTYGAVIEVANVDLALKPGMTASAHIRTAAAKDALRVSAAALRFNPPGERKTDRPGVWLIAGSALRRVEVAPGVSDGELTAIAPGSVEAGQALIVDLTPQGKKAYGLGH
ncbi:MAG TPA: efflux RND transporter periplasmic adaptor subunit [Myxococcales bacterium]|nr:efflux RND transporter periplasmic adaptor subunit [Myxococcales bacterium]